MEIYSAHHQHHHTQNLMATAANSGLEQVLSCSSKPAAPPQPQMPLPPTAQPAAAPASAGMERKPRPHPDQALKCPRCESTNTKFCYYNNYSMSQPRYFCKGCRRYWTQGGSLRNVPVGGGCRKNKRSSSSSSSSSSSASSLPSSDSKVKLVQETAVPLPTSRFPELLPTILPTAAFDLPSDHLSLAFASSNAAAAGNAVAPAGGTFLDILRGGFLDGNNSNSHHAYYGGNEMVMPFVGLMQQGGGDASAATGHGEDEATGEKVMMGFQWPSPLGGGNGGNGDLAQGVNMASNVTYWNGGVGAANSWHGLINSSLM